MGTTRTAIFALVVVVLCAVAAALGQGVARVDLASPWVELHAARVRLLAGPPAVKSAKSYLAGVEITLAEGWKTYWRTPGDAGVPPTFDWAGSTNLATIKVGYPAPRRMQEPGAETIGYTSAVIFPVEVVPRDAASPSTSSSSWSSASAAKSAFRPRRSCPSRCPLAMWATPRRRSSPLWNASRAHRPAAALPIPRSPT